MPLSIVETVALRYLTESLALERSSFGASSLEKVVKQCNADGTYISRIPCILSAGLGGTSLRGVGMSHSLSSGIEPGLTKMPEG